MQSISATNLEVNAAKRKRNVAGIAGRQLLTVRVAWAGAAKSR